MLVVVSINLMMKLQYINNKYYFSYNSKTKLLSKKQYEHLITFEKKLFDKFSSGCTSSKNYELTYKNKFIQLNDSSCSWNGYKNLFNVLEINKKQ